MATDIPSNGQVVDRFISNGQLYNITVTPADLWSDPDVSTEAIVKCMCDTDVCKMASDVRELKKTDPDKVSEMVEWLREQEATTAKANEESKIKYENLKARRHWATEGRLEEMRAELGKKIAECNESEMVAERYHYEQFKSECSTRTGALRKRVAERVNTMLATK